MAKQTTEAATIFAWWLLWGSTARSTGGPPVAAPWSLGACRRASIGKAWSIVSPNPKGRRQRVDGTASGKGIIFSRWMGRRWTLKYPEHACAMDLAPPARVTWEPPVDEDSARLAKARSRRRPSQSPHTVPGGRPLLPNGCRDGGSRLACLTRAAVV